MIFILGSMLWAATTWSYTVSGNTYTTNGSQTDVQAACSAAPDDGTAKVVIPDGTYEWSGQLTIGHALTLAGADPSGVTIKNDNATSDMIVATSTAHGHINIYWLNIEQVADNGGGAGYSIRADRVDSSPYTVMIHDCSFNNSTVYNYMVCCSGNGILFWNDTFTGDGMNGIGGISFVCQKYGYIGWNTPDTFGAEDKTGLSNSYVENCTFSNAINTSNFDDNSRVVWRHNTMQDAGLGSHGQETSIFGVRGWEIYANVFKVSSGNPYNLQDWFGVRGGTGVITQNSMDAIPSKGGIQLLVYSITRGMDDGSGGAFCPLAYPAPRQTGWGWSATSTASFGVGDDTIAGRLLGAVSPGVFGPDGIGAVLDPLYVWNNTGTMTSQPNYVFTYTYPGDNCGHNQVISTYLKQGRDYFVNVASPTWTPYTYPHPLHAAFTAK
jgi:hypothetical protein